MAHNVTSSITNPPTAANFIDLSRKVAQAINGQEGSSHAPASTIVLGGQGLDLTGPCAVLGGGQLLTSASGRFSLQDGDWPQLAAGHPGRAKRILTPGVVGFSPLLPYLVRQRVDLCAIQFNFLAIVNPNGSITPARALFPLMVLDGAPLVDVVMNLTVGVPHTVLPKTMPRAALIRIDANGVGTPLSLKAPGADANGYVAFPRPASASAWTGTQALTIPVDPGNTVDLSQYTYVLDVLEEVAVSMTAPWQVPAKVAADVVAIANVTQSGAGTVIDGFTTVNGSRVLCTAQTDPTLNGLWIVGAGAWTRAVDASISAINYAPLGFDAGFLVPVGVLGNLFKNTIWQLLSPTPIAAVTATIATPLYFSTPCLDPIPTQPPYWAYASTSTLASVPVGNIVTSIAVDHAPLDYRWG